MPAVVNMNVSFMLQFHLTHFQSAIAYPNAYNYINLNVYRKTTFHLNRNSQITNLSLIKIDK